MSLLRALLASLERRRDYDDPSTHLGHPPLLPGDRSIKTSTEHAFRPGPRMQAYYAREAAAQRGRGLPCGGEFWQFLQG